MCAFVPFPSLSCRWLASNSRLRFFQLHFHEPWCQSFGASDVVNLVWTTNHKKCCFILNINHCSNSGFKSSHLLHHDQTEWEGKLQPNKLLLKPLLLWTMHGLRAYTDIIHIILYRKDYAYASCFFIFILFACMFTQNLLSQCRVVCLKRFNRDRHRRTSLIYQEIYFKSGTIHA